MDDPQSLLDHALIMYRNVQPYCILGKRGYDIIRDLDEEKTSTKIKAKNLHELQRIIRQKIDTIVSPSEQMQIRDRIKDPRLLLKQLKREALKIPTESQLKKEVGIYIPDGFEGDFRKDWVKLCHFVPKHSLKLSESSERILSTMKSTGTLTRADLDTVIQDADEQKAKKKHRQRISLAYGEDEDGKYVLYNKRRVYLEPKEDRVKTE
jgi:hypothetical protein